MSDTGIPHGFHRSADGSVRCDRCHLHPDTCTCRADHPAREILRAAGFQIGARFDGEGGGTMPPRTRYEANFIDEEPDEETLFP